MEKFDQIWLFIEAKLEISVPLYIKNILRACGFDNGVSIASIDEDDIEYFVNEVRNGNVMKFFIENENNILEGTEIPAPKFEFTRGHKKLLLSIVEFLKTHAKENGTNHFISEVAPNKQIAKNTTNKPGLARKGSRKILNFPNNQKRQKFLRRSLPIENHNNFPNGNMKIQEGILICKAITSLINFTPELYCENAELIKSKITRDLVTVKMADETEYGTHETSDEVPEEPKASVFQAEILCPYCMKTYNVFRHQTNPFRWNTSNFDCHLKIKHINQTNINENDNIEGTDNIEFSDYQEVNDAPTGNKNKNTEANGHVPQEEKASKSKTLLSEKTTECIAETPLDVNDKQAKTAYTKSFIPSINPTNKCVPLEDCYEENIAKLNFLVCYSDTSEEDDEKPQEQQLQSEILTASPGQNLKSELNKIVFPRKSNVKINHSAKGMHDAVPRDAQKTDLTFLKPGDYVICSSSIKSSIKWPANKPIVKYFVGKILHLRERVRNKTIIEEIELQFLKKSPYSKIIFKYPEKMDISHVQRNEIIKILQDPSQNRRGEFVFKDKSVLDYNF